MECKRNDQNSYNRLCAASSAYTIEHTFAGTAVGMRVGSQRIGELNGHTCVIPMYDTAVRKEQMMEQGMKCGVGINPGHGYVKVALIEENCEPQTVTLPALVVKAQRQVLGALKRIQPV